MWGKLRALLVGLSIAHVSLSYATAGTQLRFAIVGLDHDHVWGLLHDIAVESSVRLVAIADQHPELVALAKSRVASSVHFYDDFVKMLDEAKPDAVIVTTENDRHLAILRECARRHVHYLVEKPMATSTADALEMAHLARLAKIKLMVNYWNAWVAPSQTLVNLLRTGELGQVQRINVQQGHQGPIEIGVSKFFAAWLYDPVKNGGGVVMDFASYGAEWAMWLKGRPKKVFAYSIKLKTSQDYSVEDDSTLLLEYSDATVVVQASWSWPRNKGQVEVYGPKGSLLATKEVLFWQPADAPDDPKLPYGTPLPLAPVPPEASGPIAYFADCIRNDKPIQNPVSAEMNVGVIEILDAARKSIRTSKAIEMP